MVIANGRPSIQCSLKTANAHLAISFAEPHVLFQGPDELHWPSVQSFRDGDRLAHLIGSRRRLVPDPQIGATGVTIAVVLPGSIRACAR
jgi:hypothetical protein